MGNTRKNQDLSPGRQTEDLHQALAQALDVAALALDRAERADTAKSRFMAGFSHEVRNPLNSLLGLIDLLRQTELTPRQQQFMEMIDHTGQHLLGVLNQALSFTSLEQASLELNEMEFDLPALLRGIFSPYQLQWQQRGISGQLQLDPELPALWHGDPHRLRQVLVNLLDNAGKFTQQGRITLAANMEQRNGRPFVHCRVEDTGVGIPAAKAEKIFTPFAQADGSISSRFGGTGLGLTICRQLIELMGGEIWVTGGDRSGSSFHFVLPRHPDPEPKQVPPPDAPGQTKAPVLSITGLKVLVVDDDFVGRTVTGEMLKEEGCRATLAASGEEALARLAADRFDLVLLDMQMPEMDGPATATAIRRHQRQPVVRRDEPPQPVPFLPLIAMTGESAEELGDSLAAFDGYLQKPFNRRRLLEEINSVRQARPPAAATEGKA